MSQTKTLERIEKILVAVGVLFTTLGLNNIWPGGEGFFSPEVINSISVIVGAFISIIQFFRDNEDPVSEVGTRSIQDKLNTPVKHLIIPWSKRRIV